MVLERGLEFNKIIYIAFIYLRKAFDYIPRDKLWKCLENEYGVKGKLKKAIISLYDPNLCSVRTTEGNRSWFQVKHGAKQESVMSPLLIITYLDCVINNFKEERKENPHENKILVYADDRGQ